MPQENLSPRLQTAIDKGRYDVDFFAKEFLGITPHSGQSFFLNDATEKINILSPANRWGKTCCLAIKHIHRAFYKIGIPTGSMKSWLATEYQTCALAPHSQQAEVVTLTIRQILTSCFPMRINGTHTNNKCMIEWFLVRATESYPMMVEYAFNSRTIIRSTGEDKGKSIAAKNFGYIGYDEAGKSFHLEAEVESTLLPRLADYNGTLDLVGTPDAESPSFVYFQELFWRGGGDGNPRQPGFYSQEGSVMENPHIPKSYVEDMKKAYGNSDYLQQVLYGKFISVGNKVFENKKIIEASRDMDVYLPHEEGHKYIIGVDTAIGNDEIVMTVIDWTEIPFKISKISGKVGNTQSPQLHTQDLIDLFDHYNKENQCNVILETFNGESMRFYYDLPEYIKLKTRCFGSGRIMGVTKKVGQIDRKEDILIAARKILDRGEIIFSNRHRKLIQQLSNYTLNDEKIKTDWVISFCLAVFQVTDGRPQTETLTPVSVSW